MFYPILKKLLLGFAAKLKKWRAEITKKAVGEGLENTVYVKGIPQAGGPLSDPSQRLAVFTITAGCWAVLAVRLSDLMEIERLTDIEVIATIRCMAGNRHFRCEYT